MAEQNFDLVIIGAGPGGYVAAIRAGQLGLKTACIELEPRLGGTCLRVGCIPSKALLESSELYAEAKHGFEPHGFSVKGVELNLPALMQRKDDIVTQLTDGVAFLFKKNKVERFFGHGRFDGPGRVIVKANDGSETTLTYKNAIIATGSKYASLRGVELDGDRIGGSTEALSYPEVPARLIVIGAGYIGLEMASVWSRLGSQVTVLEYLDRILPGMDSEIANEAQRMLKKQGLEFRLGTKVTGAKVVGKGKKAEVQVEIEGSEPLTADRVLVAVGRVPNTDGLNLESVDVKLDERGRVEIDDHFHTNVANIFAIGDVVKGPMLAHKAEHEGVACVEQIATGYGHHTHNIPGVVYTYPEVASVGKTEEELKAAGVEYKKGSFIFKANGRAKALNATDGRVKLLADAKTDRLLGAHIIGARAGDLIAECVMAMEFGACSEDIARTSHAHPSLSEIVKEAAWATFAQALHS